MAFEEPESTPTPSSSSQIMQYDTNSLMALLFQFCAGVITTMTFAPAVLLLLPLLISIPGGPVNLVGTISLVLLVPVGLIQIYFGYRLYNKIPNTIPTAIISDVVAFSLYIVSLISSILTNTLSSSPQMYIALLGINLVAVVLLRMPSVRNTFER